MYIQSYTLLLFMDFRADSLRWGADPLCSRTWLFLLFTSGGSWHVHAVVRTMLGSGFSVHHVPGNYVRSSGRKCAYLAQALGGMFIITVAAFQSVCFIFFKAGILVIFLKVSLTIPCRNICHRTLYSLYICTVWCLNYFDSVLLLSYCSWGKQCIFHIWWKK